MCTVTNYLEGGSSSSGYGSRSCSSGSTTGGGSSVSGPVGDGSSGVKAGVTAPLLLGGGYKLGLEGETD